MEFVQKYDAINDCYCNGEAIMDRRFMDLIDYHIPDALAAVIRRSRKLVDGYIDFMRNKHARRPEDSNVLPRQRKKACGHTGADGNIPGTDRGLLANIQHRAQRRFGQQGKRTYNTVQQLGIDIEKTMAFGDGGNDKAMLLAAGYAVAMEHGTDDIKAVADYVTQSNDEDGVARAIEKLIFGA
jgi:hypothetical protein